MVQVENQVNFITGHERIDADHRELLEHLNCLHDAVQEQWAVEDQRQVLDALIARTAEHFRHEEDLMRKMAYAGFSKHKTEHDMLLEEVRELQVRFNSGSIALTENLFDYLSEWLNFHTATTDKKLVDAINASR